MNHYADRCPGRSAGREYHRDRDISQATSTKGDHVIGKCHSHTRVLGYVLVEHDFVSKVVSILSITLILKPHHD